MEPTNEQNQTTVPVSAPEKHTSTLFIVLILLVVAAVLFWIVNATQNMNKDYDMYNVNTEDSVDGYGEPVAGAGENDEATQAESDAIRADLETETIDGTSEAL